MATDIGRGNHNENRRRIGQDIIYLGKIISEVEKDNSKNELVTGGYHLTIYSSGEAPMNHERGLFVYCIRLKERLRRVVNDDVIDWQLLGDAHSPDYLKQFLAFNVERYSK